MTSKRPIWFVFNGIISLVLAMFLLYLLHNTQIYDSYLERYQLNDYSDNINAVCVITGVYSQQDYEFEQSWDGLIHKRVFGTDAFWVEKTGPAPIGFLLCGLHIVAAISTMIAAYLNDRRYVFLCPGLYIYTMLHIGLCYCLPFKNRTRFQDSIVTTFGCTMWHHFTFINPSICTFLGVVFVVFFSLFQNLLHMEVVMFSKEIGKKVNAATIISDGSRSTLNPVTPIQAI